MNRHERRRRAKSTKGQPGPGPGAMKVLRALLSEWLDACEMGRQALAANGGDRESTIDSLLELRRAGLIVFYTEDNGGGDDYHFAVQLASEDRDPFPPPH